MRHGSWSMAWRHGMETWHGAWKHGMVWNIVVYIHLFCCLYGMCLVNYSLSMLLICPCCYMRIRGGGRTQYAPSRYARARARHIHSNSNSSEFPTRVRADACARGFAFEYCEDSLRARVRVRARGQKANRNMAWHEDMCLVSCCL